MENEYGDEMLPIWFVRGVLIAHQERKMKSEFKWSWHEVDRHLKQLTIRNFVHTLILRKFDISIRGF